MSPISNKKTAKHFLELAVKGNPRDGFKKYTNPDFKHHNAFFKGDTETIIKAMEESAKIDPNKIFEIKHIIEENNMVAVHSWLRQRSTDAGYAVIHIFRFENDKISEMWDFGQQIPETLINENGMF